MKIRLFTIYAITLLICLIAFAYFHEQVHVIIYENYGVESHVEYFSHFPRFVTLIDKNPERCTESCVFAQELNEIVGYPLSIFMTLMGLGFLYLIGLAENE